MIYEGGVMHPKSGEFWVSGIVYDVSYRKVLLYYIKYNVPFEPRRTRRWSYPPFSIYGLERSGLKQPSG